MTEIKSPLFIQCHQSYFVNLAKVNRIEDNDFIVGNDKVQISKRYFTKVKKDYMNYLCHKV